ncbi:MAG: 2-hydroxyacyl-CoA dehydratase [Chloroflexi bacterium]|nr:2-hydroxyacyl-CoA dehydratase [Chloroflexota bacterium]
MFVPRYNSEVHWGKMRESIAKLLATLEDCGGVRVSPAGLEKAVQVYRRMRQLIRKMYELRKREEPALSGAEVLGVTTASLVMPPEEFNAELEALLPLLEDRRAPLQRYTPRLLVSSEFLDDTRYLKLVEEVGCVVAMDDLDTGSRLYWSETEASQSDPLLALAIEYLKRPGCPRMSDWEGQIRQVQAWVAEFHIDGVLELGLNFSMSRHFRSPLLKSSLEESGIPFASVPREYQFANESQLRTRIGAFVELLEAQNGS